MTFDQIILVTVYGGSAIVAWLTLVWLVLWALSRIGSRIMFRLWTAELTLRTAHHLWRSTRIQPPKGWEPIPVSDDSTRRRAGGRW